MAFALSDMAGANMNMNSGETRRCIVHLPFKIDYARASASQIRPQKMIEAFQSLGYYVSVITGLANERKELSKILLKRIDNGERFDFVYSESSTMPTLLTEPSHIPINRDVDFGFFEECRKRGLRVGLFYRDVYWKFPAYRAIGWIKSTFGIHYYKADLKEYSKTVDVLFMPCEESFKIVEQETATLQKAQLPPGCDISDDDLGVRLKKVESYGAKPLSSLKLIYVGGIGAHYGLDGLLEALALTQGLAVTLCVRESDWANYDRAQDFKSIGDVNIVHASGCALEELYEDADVALMYFDADPYQSIAVPFKTFEYVAHGIPIIANSNTAAADFIGLHRVGWVIDGGPGDFLQLTKDLINEPTLVAEASRRCVGVAYHNTWESRAKTVVNLLGGF